MWPPGSSTSYKLDIIGFDACLMSMYEVGTSMSSYGRYLLASELLEPGAGWDYTVLAQIAALVQSQGDASAQGVGTLIVKSYMQAAVQVGVAVWGLCRHGVRNWLELVEGR